jgi:hypothetical protein
MKHFDLLASVHGRRMRQFIAMLALGLMMLLVVAPAALAAPDGGDVSNQQAIVKEMPEFLPEVAFVLLSTAALFVIYIRSRIQRIRQMHEIS